MTRNRPNMHLPAPQAYATARNDVMALLARITATVEAIPLEKAENANWGDVGDMNYLREQLREISDRLHREGEYA